MSNITINTDCLETVIEMINRCAIEFDNDVSSLLDSTFAPLVNVGLCGNVIGTLKAQCSTLDRRLGGCSIRVANFLTDYSDEEKELETYCENLPQESSYIESILSTDSFGFTSTPDTTSIDSVNKGQAISLEDNTNSQNINFNATNVSEKHLTNINNENQLNEQQINDSYKIKSQQLNNISNGNDTIAQSANLFEGNDVTKQNISSMTNVSSLEIKKFAEYLKTQDLTYKRSNSNVDRRI